MKKTTRTLSLLLACLMVLGVCPLGAFSVLASDTPVAAAATNEWTEEDYAALYVTDGLIFKWDAFDLEAGATVTELKNQLPGGASIALNKMFNGSTLANTSAVSKVSDGTEKDTVLGDTTATNLVADSQINTNGAVLTTATLDFSAFAPSHKVGDVTVLDDVTLEMTMFQQNYYLFSSSNYKFANTQKSAARFGPFSTARYIHDNNTYCNTDLMDPTVPADESYGFIAHTTFSYSSTSGSNTAAITDLNPKHTSNANTKVYGNYRLQTYSVAAIFDFSVEEGATTGTFDFNYARDARFVKDYSAGKYDARYAGHWVNHSSPAAAHNNYWFGGQLPFAYRALRMYSKALTEAEMAQNHAAELLDYYQVDLTVYNALAETGRAKANEALSALRLGETSKKDIEKLLNTDEYKAMTYNYSDLYIRDGLVFLWTGEGNKLTSSAQTVKAFENMVGENAIDGVSVGRHFSQVYAPVSFTYYKTDKGVHNNGGNNHALVLTTLIPTREYNGEQILSDMTLEVSQMYPSTYKTSLNGTATLSTRNFDPGYMVFGAMGNQSYTRVAYKSEYAKNEAGTLRNFVPYYYVPNAYAKDTSYVPEILYADSTTSSSTKAEFPLYRKNSEGVMVKTTTDKHGNPIDNVYCTGTAVYAEGATGKIYYTYDPYFNLSTKDADKKITINGNGHIQGGTNLPATDANGMGPIAAWSGNLSAYDYPMYGRPNFMNNYQDQAFTTSMIFNYDESATGTSIPFTFTAGRDGAFLNTTSHTYNTTNDYTSAGTMDGKFYTDDEYESDNKTLIRTIGKYAFSYGIGTAMTYYSIRLYDRALTAEEQAHNNFVDIAYQLDANVFDYIHAKQYVKDYVLRKVAGTATADWTKESFEALIAEAKEEALPPYYDLYVQNGLTYLWSGEDLEIGTGAKNTNALVNILNPEESINGTTWGRQYFNLMNQSGAYRTLSYPIVDGGVIASDSYRPILTHLVPYTVIDGKEVLTDMTLEVSQSYFDTVKTSSAGATTSATRGFDGGQAWYGPFGSVTHTKSSYNTMYVGGATYFYLLYKDADGAFHPFYRKTHETGLDGTAFYTYDAASNSMSLITDEAVNAYIREQKDGKMVNLWLNESKQHTSTTFNNHNMYAGISPVDAYGVVGVQSHNASPFSGYDRYGAKRFLNNDIHQAFTTTMIYNYAAAAVETKLDLTFGRDGAILGTTNHSYNAATDKTRGWSSGGVYYGFSSNGSPTADTMKDALEDDGRNFAFTYGVTVPTILHAIRIYNRTLTEAEIAQNNFVDIAARLKLDLRAYVYADAEIKASVHALTKGGDAADFDADALQMQIDLLVKGGKEYAEMLDASIATFEGYAIRLYNYPGLRSVFKLNRDFIDQAADNAFVKIAEIGAIVAIKGEYNDDVTDLTVDGGRQMIKEAVYENGVWAKNADGEEKLFYGMGEDGTLETYFALTTTFENAEEQTKAKFETELLYRGYVTLDLNGEAYTMYTDMTAPSFDEVSMCAVSNVFASRGWEYQDVKTIDKVLTTCGVAYEKKTFAADSFLKADGSLDTASEGDLNIVFIGGSLTEGSGTLSGQKKWVQQIAEYIQSDIFPNKKVNWVNSGIGGTNSEAAAARFCEHIAPHNPDIIFVDYTVNDDMNGFNRQRGQYNLESFLYQCSQLEKVPTVIYVQTPPATNLGSAVYNEWAEQRDFKTEWANHYSVETIDIYAYSYGKWQKEVTSGESNADYLTWLDDYYGTRRTEEKVGDNNLYGMYDVHGGYQLYVEAIKEALDTRAEDLFKPFRFMPYLHADMTDKIERTAIVKYNDDEEFFTYSDGWKYYCKDDEVQRTTGDLRIPTARWEYPFMTNGVHEAPAGETVTFKTDANALTIYYMSVYAAKGTTAGANFEVYVGDTKVATCGGASTYVQPFISSTVDLLNPQNNEITVTIKVVAKDTANPVNAFARFGSIWFSYNQ